MTYGIKRQSLLNSLKYYHVCDMGLPPDVMHDAGSSIHTEATPQHVIAEAELLTLQQLNSCPSDFDYGYIH